MIIVETDRIYSVYVRTNRRVKWRFAEYGGRWESIEKAIEKAKEHFPEAKAEYIVQTLDGEIVAQGFINVE